MQEFNKQTGMYTLGGFLHALRRCCWKWCSRVRPRGGCSRQPGHVPELPVEDAQGMELVLYCTGFPYREVHDRYDPANLLSAERLYAATLAGELGFTRDADGQVVAPPSQRCTGSMVMDDAPHRWDCGAYLSARRRVWAACSLRRRAWATLQESRRVVDGGG